MDGLAKHSDRLGVGMVARLQLGDVSALGVGQEAKTKVNGKDQLLVLLRRQLPLELRKRRIQSHPNLGDELAARLRRTALKESAQPDTPETVFARLGRL